MFMGISFFGGCVGIRSFPEDGPPGQVNCWTGDLDQYVDSFFVPQFGETRPRKGKTQVFGFERGERYRITLSWIPGREMILRVDGEDVYRAKAHKPAPEGMEIKVLRRAIIDDLSMEGVLHDD